jgi:acyl-CoA synthetase (AMP-forming)/AMP-acid ligase II
VQHLAELPERRAEHDTETLMIKDRFRQLSVGEFADEVGRATSHLADRNIRHGDVVAVMLPNRIELVSTFFAAWRLGAAVTPINPALTASEVAYQLIDSGAKLLITEDPDDARTAQLDIPILGASELSNGDGTPTRSKARLDDIALIVYTSGTTGKPKGVLLDHANLAATVDMLIEAAELSATDRALLILPLFHVNGIMVSVMGPLAAGGSSIISSFQLQSFWEEVEATRPTYFSAVPTIYMLLNALPAEVTPQVSSLRFAICGAAPMPPTAIEEFEKRYHIPLLEGYGLSEGTVASTINPLKGPRKVGTVGLPLPGQTVAIAGEDGHLLENGDIGEVVVAGPNVMRGYLNRPEDTAAALAGGWLHTGDVGYLDEDGYLVLVDRKKDMIIWGGENIYPKEIEAVLHRHEAVLEEAVIGRPNSVYGEEPVAFVVLRQGMQVTEKELLDHCSKYLARFKIPRQIIFTDALPKNAVGKISKPELRAHLDDFMAASHPLHD